MASITVSREDLFPNGTTVSAYELIETRIPTSGAPSGSVVDSGVVSGGSVTLSGLDESTSYWLYASSPDRYLRVYIPLPEAAQSGSGLIPFLWDDDAGSWTYNGEVIEARPEGLQGWRPWLGGGADADPTPAGLNMAVQGEIWIPSEVVE